MNSFNNIVRIKYLENKDCLVSLDEYILLADERKREKYAIFKLFNNLNQTLFGVKFEIVQYNQDGSIIEKNVVAYNQVAIDKNSSFIPEAKLPVLPSCVKISYNLLYAHFTTTIWENGVFRPVAISFDDYKKDIPLTKTKKELKRELKRAKINEKTFAIQERTSNKIKRKLEKDLYNLKDGQPTKVDRKNAFQNKDISKRHKPFLAKFISIVLSIVFVFGIAFSVFTSSVFGLTTYTELVSVDNFDFDYEEGAIRGYYGKDTNVVINDEYSFEENYTASDYIAYGLDYLGYLVKIGKKPQLPEKIVNKFSVVSVGEKAFKGSDIKSITIPWTVSEFSAEAFLNCENLEEIRFSGENNLNTLKNNSLRNTNLKSLELHNVYIVEEGALADCSSLKTVDIRDAEVYKNAFENSLNITHINIGSLKVNKLADLFGGKIPTSLTYININLMSENEIPYSFMDGADNVRLTIKGVDYNI